MLRFSSQKPTKINFEKSIQKWTEINEPFGKELGYPACCIKEFCEQPPELLANTKSKKTDKLRYKAACINGKFTGFVPCLEHALLINNNSITLYSLIKNRSPQFKPFPLEPFYEE